MGASFLRKAGDDLTGQPEPEEMDAVYEELRDLYLQDGIDGVLAGPPELWSSPGCRALVELGHELRYVDPDARVAFVAFAEILASRLRPGELGVRELEDLRCELALEQVWTWIDLKRADAADAALGRAAERFLRGTRGHVLTARMLDTWAMLYGNRGDFDRARLAARAALAHYEKAGERHFQGRILYRLSIIEERSGDEAKMEESLRLVVEALARLDAAVEPDLYLSAVHQRAACLVDSSRTAPAGELRVHERGADPLRHPPPPRGPPRGAGSRPKHRVARGTRARPPSPTTTPGE